MIARKRLLKILAWGAVLLGSIIAGVTLFAYVYVTDSDTLAGVIRDQAPRFLPGSRVDVDRVRLRPILGEIQLSRVAVRQVVDGAPMVTLSVPYLSIMHDPWANLKGRFEPRRVVVAHPTIRLRRRKDGTWNLQGALADPWPSPSDAPMPPLSIKGGTIELSDGAGPPSTILTGVELEASGGPNGLVRFVGSGRGGDFDRVALKGSLEPSTGRVALAGDLSGLRLSESLRGKLPEEARTALLASGVVGGEVDLKVERLDLDPAAPPARRLRYRATGHLRSGVWNCPLLPFALNDLSAEVSARDGRLTVERAQGFNGPTTVRARGTIDLGASIKAPPMDMKLEVIRLDLDGRLKARTPAPFLPLWDEFQPSGQVNLAVHAVRQRAGGPVGFGLTVECLDVAMTYHLFRYRLEHLRGTIKMEGNRVRLERLATVVGGKALTCSGTIDHPGPDAEVKLTFDAEEFPIDRALFDALPPDVLKVVRDFRPTGSVRGRAELTRRPPRSPDEPPEGLVAIDATLDLSERCSIQWAGLPYPVDNLTGQLELHPDRWVFRNMRGQNGPARIEGGGEVEKLPGRNPDGTDRLRVDMHVAAQKLPFDEQLRDALPPAWRKTWEAINPTGSAAVDAKISVEPGQPDRYHLELLPGPDTGIGPRYTRPAVDGVDPGGTFELRMDDIAGRFVFDDGVVTMGDVAFRFRDAPIAFETGRVEVRPTGAFELAVRKLRAKGFRFDDGLRATMPPVMAQFARRLDDGKTFTFDTDLDIGWSGRPGESVICRWDHGLVIFDDNTAQAGIPLEHIQGQFSNVKGRFQGNDLNVTGALDLASVRLRGQQLTQLSSPLVVGNGHARLTDIRGKLLDGVLSGDIDVSLDATPAYNAKLRLDRASLRSYAQTLPGRQDYRGFATAEMVLGGRGYDLRSLQGSGSVQVTQANLGQLPFVLQLFAAAKRFERPTKTAFDEAEVQFVVRDGLSTLEPILLAGNAFSLMGRGTMGVQGVLDLRLHLLVGRARRKVPVFTDAGRGVGAALLVIRVQGTPAAPKFAAEPFPSLTPPFRAIGRKDDPPRR